MPLLLPPLQPCPPHSLDQATRGHLLFVGCACCALVEAGLFAYSDATFQDLRLLKDPLYGGVPVPPTE